MIVANIDVTKIDKTHLYDGKKGKYLSVALHERPDDYGNDGFVAQGVSKEARDKGVKGPIIGSWKNAGVGKQKRADKPAAQKAEAKPASGEDAADSEIPF